jgi:hypothetical protein
MVCLPFPAAKRELPLTKREHETFLTNLPRTSTELDLKKYCHFPVGSPPGVKVNVGVTLKRKRSPEVPTRFDPSLKPQLSQLETSRWFDTKEQPQPPPPSHDGWVPTDNPPPPPETIPIFKAGRWSSDEVGRMAQAVKIYGNDFQAISNQVLTRDIDAIRAYFNRYFTAPRPMREKDKCRCRRGSCQDCGGCLYGGPVCMRERCTCDEGGDNDTFKEPPPKGGKRREKGKDSDDDPDNDDAAAVTGCDRLPKRVRRSVDRDFSPHASATTRRPYPRKKVDPTPAVESSSSSGSQEGGGGTNDRDDDTDMEGDDDDDDDRDDDHTLLNHSGDDSPLSLGELWGIVDRNYFSDKTTYLRRSLNKMSQLNVIPPLFNVTHNATGTMVTSPSSSAPPPPGPSIVPSFPPPSWGSGTRTRQKVPQGTTTSCSPMTCRR